MGRSVILPLPSLQRRMTAIGENLRLARLRRGLTAAQVAERADISRKTLTEVEKGSSAVSFGVYCNVLFVLGLDKDLDNVGADDELGRKLQDLQIATPRRAGYRARTQTDGAE